MQLFAFFASLACFNAVLHVSASGSTPASGPVQPASVVAAFTKYTRLACIAYYKDAQSITSWSCPDCRDPSVQDSTQVSFIATADGSEQGYVAISPSLQSIIFAVRGSASPDSYFQDMSLVEQQISYSGSPSNMEVHSGFWSVYKQMQPLMQPVLQSYMAQNPTYTVSFVGHSLGAAVVTLAALDLAATGQLGSNLGKVNLVTMGQPRIGNPAFGTFLKSLGFNQISRLVNYDDIVPHM
ncbi:hypothetical protein HDU98_009706, partial [Podochytrium sp. JEL0797]